VCASDLATDGTTLAAKQFAGAGYSLARRLAVDAAGRVTISGNFSSSLTVGNNVLQANASYNTFLLSLDAQLEPRWAKRLDSRHTWSSTSPIAVDESGNVFVGRVFTASIIDDGKTLTANGSDFIITKFSHDGTRLYSHVFGESDSDELRAVATDSSGALWMTGFFSSDLDLGGDTLNASSGFDVFLGKLSR
jgi:hypothetical protein